MEAIDKKVKDLDELASIVASEKSAGRTVVHWHGLFDVLDPGNIRQIHAAKALGDVLVVTLVAARYLAKERDLPGLSDTVRAESVAALQAVDYVGVGRTVSGASLIHQLRPDVYVHDSDEVDRFAGGDGGATVEMEAVRAIGGTLRYASDLGGSTNILATRLWSPIPDEVGAWLDDFRQRHDAREVIGALRTVETLRVLIVGEVILDEYVYCEALGKSSKEPILALRYLYQDVHAGGSIAIANHLADFCASADLVAYLGAFNAHEEFVRASVKPSITPYFIRKADSPTIVKRRFVEKNRVAKLLEVYEINDELLSEVEEQQLCQELERLLPNCDVVIVADFGHGLIPSKAADLLSERAPFLALNTQINAANIGFHTVSKYKRADYICMNEAEMRLDARTRKGDLRDLVINVADRLQCDTVMVTRGTTGTLLFSRREGFSACPAFAIKVVDRLGAGDTVLAITALCAAKGFPPDVIGFIGNLVGAQAVRIVGNSRSIDKLELFRNIESLLR